MFHLRVDIVDVNRSCCQRLGRVVRRRRLSHPSGWEFESSLTIKTLDGRLCGQRQYVKHVEPIRNFAHVVKKNS